MERDFRVVHLSVLAAACGDLVGATFDQGKFCLFDREESMLNAVLPTHAMDADLRASAGGRLRLAFDGALTVSTGRYRPAAQSAAVTGGGRTATWNC